MVMHCEGCAGSVRKTLRKIPGDASDAMIFHQQYARVLESCRKEMRMRWTSGQRGEVMPFFLIDAITASLTITNVACVQVPCLTQ